MRQTPSSAFRFSLCSSFLVFCPLKTDFTLGSRLTLAEFDAILCSVGHILVPRASVSFGHVVGETEGSGNSNYRHPRPQCYSFRVSLTSSPGRNKKFEFFHWVTKNGCAAEMKITKLYASHFTSGSFRPGCYEKKSKTNGDHS